MTQIDFEHLDYSELAYEHFHGEFDLTKLIREIGIEEVEKVILKIKAP